MQIKKHLSFDALRTAFSHLLYHVKEPRQQSKVRYRLHDAVMSGLACMFLQSPSLLDFQRRLEARAGRSNLKTLFNVHHIPENTSLRDTLDKVDSAIFAPLFKNYVTRLQRGKQLKQYQFLPNLYLLPLDGTQYFSSKEISCDCCLTTTSAKGISTYSHKVVQAAIVHPDIKQVIPLMPEAIANTDGSQKQDCEINAAKRLMQKLKKQHPRMGFIRTGDSLYAHTPFIEETLQQGDHFIFAMQPGDHQYLTELLKTTVFSEHREIDDKGRQFTYEWFSEQPLTAKQNSLKVNVIRCRLTSLDKKTQKNTVTYLGTWITDLEVNEENVAYLIRGARARWRIENECFNTLKNQGYQVEHNYGHGQRHLCLNFYILTVLAFLMHQIGDLCDKAYQAARKITGTLKGFWGEVRTLFNLFLFESWYKLLEQLSAPDIPTFIWPKPGG